MEGTPVQAVRRSPVNLPASPAETAREGGWEVVRAYRDEGEGPFLVDLSHRPKWDVQHAALTGARPWGLMFPDTPGQCRMDSGLLLNRMTHTQAGVWSLSCTEPPAVPEPFFTDVTDGLCLLALLGEPVFSLLERVTGLDLAAPDRQLPRLVLGPVLHVPCQVVVLGPPGERAAVLLACSRGYGPSMAHALLESGAAWGFRPAGERAFLERIPRWFSSSSTSPGPPIPG